MPVPSRRLACGLSAVLLAVCVSAAASGPRPADPLSAPEIRIALERLRVTGSVLYVAAHPDDENTAMLAWLARERKVRTAYLSMTRGDGGQNLIGTELGAELGVIRTQELLAARRTDGAEQFFTRAVDFGFSKGPDETFAIWGRDSILSDVVRVIRRFRPDVIVTRFPTEGGGGHGHHTASAILAEEAFRAAADPARLPDCGPVWQAKRLLWNAFMPDGRKADSSWIRVDVGTYNPLLGRSYGEIAAISRSNHKSQGFGVPERHGALPQFLALRVGEPAKADLLDGVDLSWKRVKGGERVDALLARAAREYDPAHPQALLPRLREVDDALHALTDDAPWLRAKRAELTEVIRSCAGLWVEAVALKPSVTAGESLDVVVSVVRRTGAPVNVTSIALGDMRHEVAREMSAATALADTLHVRMAPSHDITQPYWLRGLAGKGRFEVADPALIGQPENGAALTAHVELTVGPMTRDVPLTLDLPVAYRWADPVQGERWRALEVAPPATLQFDHVTYVFPDRAPRDVQVVVLAQRAGVSGRLVLALPAGWTCVPASAEVSIARAGEETRTRFVVTPGEGPAAATLSAIITVDGRPWSHRMVRIDYPHIPVQTLFPPATVPAVRADIRHAGTRVGYIAGSGDATPDALHQLGYEMTALTDDDIEGGDLARFDAIVSGVRAFNTRPRLAALKGRLMDYVKQGGTLLVQYNTTGDGNVRDLGPYPFTISRDRVTVEEAPLRVLKPGHVLLTTPNAIGDADFEGWVQERGLYFANPWDPRYETPLSCNDPGEPARDGGLLVTNYGKGVFEYCAFAMFRQLPAGVPGAWRLFANLLSARGAATTP